MLSKKYLYIIAVLIFTTIISLIFVNRWNSNISDDPVLIRIGNKEEKLSSFLKNVNSNLQFDPIASDYYLNKLDNLISAELYILSNPVNLLNDTAPVSVFKQNSILSDILYQHEPETIIENNKLLIDCYEKDKEILILDYVWMPDRLVETALHVKNILEVGQDLEYFRKLKEYDKMLSNNVLIFPKRLIKGGSLSKEVQEVAYKMKENEVEIIHTKSGIYIMRLFKRFKNEEHYGFEVEKYRIHKRIQETKLEENAKYFFDPLLFEKKVFINTDKLSLLDLYYKPFKDTSFSIEMDDRIIAVGLGKKIMFDELLAYLNKLPLNIQVLLTENKSRLKIFESIILEELKTEILDVINYKVKTHKENLMVDFLIKDKYLSCNKNLFEKDSIVLEMSEWVNGFLSANHNQSSLYALLLSEAYSNELEKSKIILDKVSSYRDYLFDKSLLHKFGTISSCKTISINYDILDTIQINNYLLNNERNVAYVGKWKLTNKLFLKYIRGLTFETKLELVDPENCFKLIEHIAKKELNDYNIDQQKLIIDKAQFFSKPEYLDLNTMDIYTNLSRTDIIASYDTIEINVGELNSIFFGLNSSDKRQLLNENTREEFVKKLMRRLILKKELENSKLRNQNLNVKVAESYLNYDKLFFQFYGCNLKLDPKGIEGVYFRLALKRILEFKVRLFIDQQLKNEKIQLNYNVANQIGLNTDLSAYKAYFTPLELTP